MQPAAWRMQSVLSLLGGRWLQVQSPAQTAQQQTQPQAAWRMQSVLLIMQIEREDICGRQKQNV